MLAKILRHFSLTLFSCLALMGPAHADTIFGKVVNPAGVGVAGVKITFSGILLPVFTALDGTFTAIVPTGTYDIEIVPKVTNLAPLQILGVQVLITKNMGTITLKPGFPISGKVITTGNLPVAGADINVYDQATRQILFTPNDNTGLLGSFMVVVPAGTYRVRVRPAPAVLLVTQEIENVSVSLPKILPPIFMPPGIQVTGKVVDAATLLPIPDVDLDANDAVTGDRIVTPSDNTNALGVYSLILPARLVHLSFDPPATTPYVGFQRLNVQIAGPSPQALGTTVLPKGFVLSGTVLGPGLAPVVDADIDVDMSPGAVRVYTPHDNTDANGRFSVVVPGGTYTLTVEPRITHGLVGAITAPMAVNTNLTVATINLVAGVILSGTITAHDGKPEVDADIDVINPTTGIELITPSDNTNSLGKYSVTVPTGTWNIRIQTGKTSMSRVAEIKGVSVTGPKVLNHNLTLAPILCYFGTLGIPTVPQGGPIPALLVFLNPTAQTQQSQARLVFRDPLGKETLLIPPLHLFIPSQMLFISTMMLIVPQANPILLGLPFRLELRFDDVFTGQEQDHSSFKFIIK